MLKPKRGTDWPWVRTEGSQVVFASAIKQDKTFQVRTQSIPAVARKYAHEMQAGMKFPPVEVGKVGDVRYLLSGWHRMEAAVLINGQEAIEATISTMTYAEAIWKAAEANLTQGQGYTAKEKRNVLKAYIKAGKHKEGRCIVKTYRDIGRQLGIKIGTLHRWMELDHPYTFRAMGGEDTHAEPAEPPLVNTDPENLRRAQQALRDALAYCDALRSPLLRGEVIADARQVTAQMNLKENVEAEWWKVICT